MGAAALWSEGDGGLKPGLKGPPNKDPRTAKVFILAHLLMVLLLEPLIEAFEDSPHWANAA